jgi:hypothetical protein
VTLAELNNDAILQAVRDSFPAKAQRFFDALDNAKEAIFLQGLDRLSDVRTFLNEASVTAGDTGAFIEAFLKRHGDVQHGKFDRGRRKMPWLERNDSRISLTMTRTGGLSSEITSPEQIQPHPYRLRAADALIFASKAAAK